MKLNLLSQLLLIIFFGFFSIKGLAAPAQESSLGLIDRGMAWLIDYGLNELGYQFSETEFISSQKENLKIKSLTMGQALILNQRLNSQVTSHSYVGTIASTIWINGHSAGKIQLQWRPSQSFFSFMIFAIKYRLGRAFLLSPQFFNPKETKILEDSFTLHWKNVDLLEEISSTRSELDFVKEIFRKNLEVDSESDDVSIQGVIKRKADKKTNKVIFNLYLQGKILGGGVCQQKLETNYNPYARKLSYLQGQIKCDLQVQENP